MDSAGSLWEDLSSILDVMQQSDVNELFVREGDVSVRLRRRAVSDGMPSSFEVAIADDTGHAEPSSHTITARLVGTFYRSAHPGGSPFVSEGTAVEEETIVGIIEALHVLTEVEAGCVGTIIGVLTEDGCPVEYGQPLFEVSPRA